MERELEKCILHGQSAYWGGERPMTSKNLHVRGIEERIESLIAWVEVAFGSIAIWISLHGYCRDSGSFDGTANNTPDPVMEFARLRLLTWVSGQ